MRIPHIACAAILIAALPSVHAEDTVAPPKRMSYAERLRQRRASMTFTRSTRAVDLLVLLREDKQEEVIERLEQEIDRSVCSAWKLIQSKEAKSHKSETAFLQKIKKYRSVHPAGSSGDRSAEARRILDQIEITEAVEQDESTVPGKAAPSASSPVR